MAKELLTREEMRPEDTWDVSDMYATVSDWEAELTVIHNTIDELAKLEGHSTDSATHLLEALNLDMKISEKLGLAGNYAHRLFDIDQGNTTHQAMAAKIGSLYAKYGEKTAFLVPEILSLDAETLEVYYKESSDLEFYRRHIDEIIRMKPHTLSAEMEKLIALTSEMSGTASNAFSMFNNADVVFPEIEDENGEMVRITHGRQYAFLKSSNRRVRKDAYMGFHNAYKQYLNTLAALYNGQVKQLVFHAKARNYNSTLEAGVDRAGVSPSIYYNLVDTVTKNVDKMHRYIALKKKYLGFDEMHMYDVSLPMFPDFEKTVTYDEAKETVLKALAPMGEDYVSKVKEGFENRWLDVYENQGKCTGAYSAGAYGTHPYVLMNYSDTFHDMFTIAHEMGHALHSYYSNETQPYTYANYTMFIAEVSSTCNEILLNEYLLRNTTDKKERAYILNHYIEMFKGTVFFQTHLAEFEMLSNAMVEAGEDLNADNLNDLYLKLNEKYYGPALTSDKEVGYDWARISHFYMNFYLYQYATGFTSAVAIAKSILDEGAPAVERYKKFLSGGCSDSPLELLKIAGVNLETPAPIQSALDVMDGLLDELEELL